MQKVNFESFSRILWDLSIRGHLQTMICCGKFTLQINKQRVQVTRGHPKLSAGIPDARIEHVLLLYLMYSESMFST